MRVKSLFEEATNVAGMGAACASSPLMCLLCTSGHAEGASWWALGDLPKRF